LAIMEGKSSTAGGSQKSSAAMMGPVGDRADPAAALFVCAATGQPLDPPYLVAADGRFYSQAVWEGWLKVAAGKSGGSSPSGAALQSGATALIGGFQIWAQDATSDAPASQKSGGEAGKAAETAQAATSKGATPSTATAAAAADSAPAHAAAAASGPVHAAAAKVAGARRGPVPGARCAICLHDIGPFQVPVILLRAGVPLGRSAPRSSPPIFHAPCLKTTLESTWKAYSYESCSWLWDGAEASGAEATVGTDLAATHIVVPLLDWNRGAAPTPVALPKRPPYPKFRPTGALSTLVRGRVITLSGALDNVPAKIENQSYEGCSFVQCHPKSLKWVNCHFKDCVFSDWECWCTIQFRSCRFDGCTFSILGQEFDARLYSMFPSINTTMHGCAANLNRPLVAEFSRKFRGFHTDGGAHFDVHITALDDPSTGREPS
jgi:hypothetical protein